MGVEVNRELVEKLTQLAALSFDDEELERMVHDLRGILAMVEKLRQLDVGAFSPSVHPFEIRHPLREDVPTAPASRQECLQRAAVHDSDYVHVPQVLEK